MKLPPTSAHLSPDDSFKTGALIMYENDGSVFIGAVVGFKNKKYQVLNMRGREVDLQALRLHPLNSSLPSDISTIDKKSAYLVQLFERCHKQALELNLEEIWSLTRDEGDAFTSSAIGNLYYSKPNHEQLLTLRLALIADRIYFKRKGDDFSPRPPETVEELKKSEEAAAKKVKAQEVTLNFFIHRLKQADTPVPVEAQQIISLLEDTAAGITDIEHNRQKEIKEFMNLFCEKTRLELPATKEIRAFIILEKIHHFSKNTNLALIRYRPQITFSSEALEEAKNLNFAKSSSDNRLDYTHVWCATIDDISTKDMDDAVSIEQHSDGYTLGIHISDVASIVPADSATDKDARFRATSLYLPDQTINMLPNKLSDDSASLVANQSRPALSCFFELDRNYKILSSKLTPTLIKVKERLDYNTVTKLLETDNGKLLTLYQIATSEENRRIVAGAHKVSKKEVLFYPKENGEVGYNEIDEDDPARAMIGELMVLANSFMADYAAKNNIPVLYRGQEQPATEAATGNAAPTGPAADFAERSKLKKSTVGFEPTPHAGLGLSAYLQATSPIRRYVDLCNQRQFISFINTGKPFYSKAQYEKILEEIDITLANAGFITKETRRFWLLKYIEQMHKHHQELSGTVVRLGERTPLVELDKLYVTVFARLRDGHKLGDHVDLKIESINPRLDYLKLSEK